MSVYFARFLLQGLFVSSHRTFQAFPANLFPFYLSSYLPTSLSTRLPCPPTLGGGRPVSPRAELPRRAEKRARRAALHDRALHLRAHHRARPPRGGEFAHISTARQRRIVDTHELACI
eukprot:6179358-Pleurochrysis_carterae.AAC.2